MLCPYCNAGLLRADTVAVAVTRDGHMVREVHVAAWRCRNCGERSFSDDVIERAVATLEEHTRPGDEIVVVDEGPTAGSA